MLCEIVSVIVLVVVEEISIVSDELTLGDLDCVGLDDSSSVGDPPVPDGDLDDVGVSDTVSEI